MKLGLCSNVRTKTEKKKKIQTNYITYCMFTTFKNKSKTPKQLIFSYFDNKGNM